MTQLIVSFELEGKHFWPAPPAEYSDFANSHRHLFKFICQYHIHNSNSPVRRDKELFELRREAIQCLKDGFVMVGDVVDYGNMSCEGIADYLKEKMNFSSVFCGEEWFLGAIV